MPLDHIWSEIQADIPADFSDKLKITRPRCGGDLWDSEDEDDRRRITDLLINGHETLESLQPVAELLLRRPVHEDFSARFSWIKEDFERAFYSKRSKIRVSLYELTDDIVVRDGDETPGYENLLLRDIMAFFDLKDRHIILALRQGRTRSSIAEELGLKGHASVVRRVQRIQKKMRRILRDG